MWPEEQQEGSWLGWKYYHFLNCVTVTIPATMNYNFAGNWITLDLYYFFFLKKYYLFLERGREGERGGEKH